MKHLALKCTAIALFIGICHTFAQQKTEKREFKFGKITPAEFETKAFGVDSAAAAVKLFDVGNCYFEVSPVSQDFVYVYERHIRYKIINKNAYDLADFAIQLYKSNGSGKEELYYMDAATYNMVDGKMVVSKLNKDAKFSESFDKNHIIKKFTLPNVKEGAIIEFKYKIKSDFIFTLRGWSFQSSYPTLYSEYNVKIPEYLKYKHNKSGYYLIDHPKQEVINANYVSGVTSTANYDQYALSNVPAFKDEPFITTMDDYIPRIDFELRATSFPGQLYKDYTGSWPKIVNELISDENFGTFINKNSYAKSVLQGVLKDEKDTLTMVKLITNYVKQHLTWNKDYNFYSSQNSPKVVFEKKTGSSADINLSLLSLLKEAKLNAHPLLISTRDNGQHPGLPVLTAFNNVVGLILIGGKVYYLDATDINLPVGMLQYNNLNHQGFLINLKTRNGAWISTEPEIESERNYVFNFNLEKDHKFKGTLNQYAKGYSALTKRGNYRSASNEADYVKSFKSGKSGLEVLKYQILNVNNLDELLTESMEVEIDDNVEEAGNLIYFSPLLFERTKENIFKHEERKFPVDFAYPFKENYRITINFPADYEVDKLPVGGIYKLPDNKGSFSISYFMQDKTLLVRSIININQSVYNPEDYFDLKELFKTIVSKQAEQIVFKKKS